MLSSPPSTQILRPAAVSGVDTSAPLAYRFRGAVGGDPYPCVTGGAWGVRRGGRSVFTP